MIKFRVATLGLAVALAVLAFAVPAMAHPSKATGSVTVTAGDIWFKLSTKSVAHGTVTFNVKNSGKLQHDFKIAGKKTKLLSGGQSATLTVNLAKGSYPYECTVPGHAAAGMKGTLKVT
jgi:uncharacterized cupredoxin-like copper-binding protein